MIDLIERLLKYPTLYCQEAADRIRELEQLSDALNYALRAKTNELYPDLRSRITELEARAEKAEAELNSAREVNRVLLGQLEEECKAADKARAEHTALIEETRKLRDEAYEQGKHEGEATAIKRCIEATAHLTDADIYAGIIRALKTKEPT